MAPDTRRIISIKAWCEMMGVSLSTGKRILASEDGPPVTRLSKRRLGILIDHALAHQDRSICKRVSA
jgi:hypothetical protein